MQISKRFIVLLVVLVIAVGLGAAWASAQDNDTIYACANPAGQLRVLDGPEDCWPKETPLQWNIDGPEGPPGPPGVLRFYIKTQTADLTPEVRTLLVAYCDEGDMATGGGWKTPRRGVAPDPVEVDLELTRPVAGPDGSTPIGWEVEFQNRHLEVLPGEMYVVCADVTP